MKRSGKWVRVGDGLIDIFEEIYRETGDLKFKEIADDLRKKREQEAERNGAVKR